jgi:hypothetical protein
MFSVPTRQPIGFFEPRATKDAQAQMRQGTLIFAINWLQTQADEDVAEIQFDDGTWMLAGSTDIGPVRHSDLGSLAPHPVQTSG